MPFPIPKSLAALALAATLAACTPAPGPITATNGGPDQRHYTRAGDVVAARVFGGGQNCTPDCFEVLARSGCDYDCRKKETLIGAGAAK